jgi:hypothetical protein
MGASDDAALQNEVTARVNIHFGDAVSIAALESQGRPPSPLHPGFSGLVP